MDSFAPQEYINGSAARSGDARPCAYPDSRLLGTHSVFYNPSRISPGPGNEVLDAIPHAGFPERRCGRQRSGVVVCYECRSSSTFDRVVFDERLAIDSACGGSPNQSCHPILLLDTRSPTAEQPEQAASNQARLGPAARAAIHWSLAIVDDQQHVSNDFSYRIWMVPCEELFLSHLDERQPGRQTRWSFILCG